MPFLAEDAIDIPDMSVISCLFTSPTHELSKDPLFLDAESPETNFLTLDSYRLHSQRFAAGLRKNGFKPGQRLLLYSTNSIYYLIVYMGTVMAGGIFTGSSPVYTARELAHHFKDADPSVICVFPSGLDNSLKAAKEAGLSNRSIFVFDGMIEEKESYSHPHWSKLLVSEEEGRKWRWDPCNTPESAKQTIALNYSSGTTGLPKGVEMSHKNFVANLKQVEHVMASRPDPYTKDSVHLCFLPLNHAMAQLMLAFGVPVWGGRVYMQEKFDFMAVMKAIEKFKVDKLALVPPIIVGMGKSADLRAGKIDLSSVRTVQTGAAPVSADSLREFKKLFKPDARVYVRNGYGMSEATCGITSGPQYAEEHLIGSVGKLLPGMEAKMMAEDGRTEITGRGGPETGERGELWVRGPNVMKGYWRKADATAATITPDGWLRTGDVVTVDRDGSIYIVDRFKELIKVRGNQVAPAELEALLLEHAAVADAAVIGVPTPDGADEVPRAYVQLKPGEKVDERDIQAFVAARVNKNKHLAGGVRYMPEGIPKNPSGKILRKLLREMAAKERKSKL